MSVLSGFMPPIDISGQELKKWGALWRGMENPETGKAKGADCFDRQQSVNFASFIDKAFATSLAKMLGDIPVVEAPHNKLIPPIANCVEVGPSRIIGGVRPQNFDVAYRPDGVRVAFDSKTLNDLKSVGKNWQNMINDLATEAATVHTRFPYALVAFMVVIPAPALGSKQKNDMVRTLERLSTRREVLNQTHLAEVISFIVWDPDTGKISSEIPSVDSTLRVEKFPEIFHPIYMNRYKGLPPHEESSDAEF